MRHFRLHTLTGPSGFGRCHHDYNVSQPVMDYDGFPGQHPLINKTPCRSV